MKLEMVSGCIADSLTADGKEEADMTTEERMEVTKAIFKWLQNNPDENERFLNYLMQTFMHECGELSVSDKPCSCCGDTICTWTLEID